MAWVTLYTNNKCLRQKLYGKKTTAFKAYRRLQHRSWRHPQLCHRCTGQLLVFDQYRTSSGWSIRKGGCRGLNWKPRKPTLGRHSGDLTVFEWRHARNVLLSTKRPANKYKTWQKVMWKLLTVFIDACLLYTRKCFLVDWFDLLVSRPLQLVTVFPRQHALR